MNNFKEQKAITLVALIITIVILVILAGVSINLAVGENGLLTKAENAVSKYQSAQKNEQEQLESVYYYGASNSVIEITKAISGENSTQETAKKYIGKSVMYNGDSNWEILYAGNQFSNNGTTHVYLISKISRGENTTLQTESINANASEVILDAKEMCSWFKMYGGSATVEANLNAKETYYMLTASNFEEFCDEEFANWAIGGPTEDILIESYNKYYGKTYTYKANIIDYNATGYSYGRRGIGEQQSTSLADTGSLPKNSIYNRNFFYWIASPSSSGSTHLRCVLFDYARLNYSYPPCSNSLRPVVCLKSDTNLNTTDNVTFIVE